MIYHRNDRSAWNANFHLSYNILLPRQADSWLPPPSPRVYTDCIRSYADVIIKFSRMDRLPNFLSYGAPLAHAWSSTIKNLPGSLQRACKVCARKIKILGENFELLLGLLSSSEDYKRTPVAWKKSWTSRICKKDLIKVSSPKFYYQQREIFEKKLCTYQC